ncbi:hypothetical protein LTR28_006087 [Elasticomyces elasticus]|nr:hypothetical protein LTR28_006087 [Elasticomyces elasticus]
MPGLTEIRQIIEMAEKICTKGGEVEILINDIAQLGTNITRVANGMGRGENSGVKAAGDAVEEPNNHIGAAITNNGNNGNNEENGNNSANKEDGENDDKDGVFVRQNDVRPAKRMRRALKIEEHSDEEQDVEALGMRIGVF